MTAGILLRLHQGAVALIEPAAPAFLRWRQSHGKEDGARWRERLGYSRLPRPDGPLAWLHGASVGEGLALLPLVDRLVLRGFSVLVTTGTVNSSRVMSTRLPAGVVHQFVPLDLPRAARRFFDHWRPDLVAFAESELWPSLIREARRRRIPAVLVNARMSDRSFRRWSRVRSVVAEILGSFAVVLAQSDHDAERLRRLSGTPIDSVGNLKFDVTPPPAPAEALERLRRGVGNRAVWVAASIHESEEAACLAVHEAVRQAMPDLLTILVPRQPNRGVAIERHASARGISVRLRSRGDGLDAATDVYVADTVGELGLFYRIAPVAFMGKSLGHGGGQNPIEPARTGTAILHGPLVGNFAEIYDLLDRSGGAIEVADAARLADEVASLLSDSGRAAMVARVAEASVDAAAGAVDRTMALIEPICAVILRAPPP